MDFYANPTFSKSVADYRETNTKHYSTCICCSGQCLCKDKQSTKYPSGVKYILIQQLSNHIADFRARHLTKNATDIKLLYVRLQMGIFTWWDVNIITSSLQEATKTVVHHSLCTAYGRHRRTIVVYFPYIQEHNFLHFITSTQS